MLDFKCDCRSARLPTLHYNGFKWHFQTKWNEHCHLFLVGSLSKKKPSRWSFPCHCFYLAKKYLIPLKGWESLPRQYDNPGQDWLINATWCEWLVPSIAHCASKERQYTTLWENHSILCSVIIFVSSFLKNRLSRNGHGMKKFVYMTLAAGRYALFLYHLARWETSCTMNASASFLGFAPLLSIPIDAGRQGTNYNILHF